MAEIFWLFYILSSFLYEPLESILRVLFTINIIKKDQLLDKSSPTRLAAIYLILFEFYEYDGRTCTASVYLFRMFCHTRNRHHGQWSDLPPRTPFSKHLIYTLNWLPRKLSLEPYCDNIYSVDSMLLIIDNMFDVISDENWTQHIQI